MSRGKLTLLAVATIAAAIAFTAVSLTAGRHHTASVVPAGARSSSSSLKPTSKPAASRPQIHAAIAAFTASYARFLDGASVKTLGDASITATAQAQQDGRIPVAFRDGILHVQTASRLASSCCSAQQTIVLANRQESYPFTVSLLDDGPHGWQVASIVPVDLAIDRNIKPATGFTIPATGQAAAHAFARGYVAFKAGTGPPPANMTAAAAAQITRGTDSLAGQKLPKAAPVLEQLKYGPPSGTEFAATATVKVGARTETFTFLMTLDHGAYKATAFL